jgi:hypothetical protein
MGLGISPGESPWLKRYREKALKMVVASNRMGHVGRVWAWE